MLLLALLKEAARDALDAFDVLVETYLQNDLQTTRQRQYLAQTGAMFLYVYFRPFYTLS